MVAVGWAVEDTLSDGSQVHDAGASRDQADQQPSAARRLVVQAPARTEGVSKGRQPAAAAGGRLRFAIGKGFRKDPDVSPQQSRSVQSTEPERLLVDAARQHQPACNVVS